MWHFKCGNLHLELHPTCAQGQGFVRFSDEEVTASPLCGEAGVFSLTNFAVCSLNLGLCWGDIGGISGFVRYNRGYNSFFMSTFVNLSALTGGYSQKTPDCFEFKSSQSGDINSKARAFQNPKRLGFRQFTAAFYLPDVQQVRG